LRFRNNISELKPGPYCWESKSGGESRISSFIHFMNKPYAAKYEQPEQSRKSVLKVALYTCTYGTGRNIDRYMYQHLSKQYYAARHGYTFSLQLSNKFYKYFPEGTFAPGFDGDYELNVMAKVVMTLDVMYNQMDADWIFFTDEDVHINALWTFLPLDAYLEDIPRDKVFVHTNYRSLMSGAFFIRNNEQGRRLVHDWLAVVMSGFVSCHGFDQAALAVLFFLKQIPQEQWTTVPFDFDCSNTIYPITPAGRNGTGCTQPGGSWSCDYMFERKLLELGFHNVGHSAFFKQRFSSYSRGCANTAVREFHVVAETALRPRLQCFHCTRINELGTVVWDGHLGGGNDYIREGAVDGYFTNHKVDWLFHEQWLKPDACLFSDTFVPSCTDPDPSLSSTSGSDENQKNMYISGRFLSLVDGFALDLRTGNFCRVELVELNRQNKYTYMREYSLAIKAAHAYSGEQWTSAYRQQGGGESRSHCKDKSSHEECGTDGLAWRKKGEDPWYILRQDYCDKCMSGKQTSWPGQEKRSVVDCSHGTKTMKDVY